MAHIFECVTSIERDRISIGLSFFIYFYSMSDKSKEQNTVNVRYDFYTLMVILNILIINLEL